MVQSAQQRVVLVLLLALLIGVVANPARAATGVVYEASVAGGSTSLATVSTSSAVTAVAGQLYLAAVTTKAGSVTVRSIKGLGLTWTLVKAQCAGRNQTRLEVWRAIGTPTSSEAVVATLSAKATSAVIAVSRYSGVDATTPLGTMASANTRGADGTCSGGVDNAMYSVNITTSAPGVSVYGAVATRNRTHTPGSGYTERLELAQGKGGDITSVAIEDRTLGSASTLR